MELNAYGNFDNDPAAAESFLRKVRSARKSAAFFEAAKCSSDENLRRTLNLAQPHWADADIFKYALVAPTTNDDPMGLVI